MALSELLELPGCIPTAERVVATVARHERVARGTFVTRLECPAIARQIRPGQFFMVRAPRRDDPLLGRPFALLDVATNEAGEIDAIEFGYVVVGKLTALLAGAAVGDEFEVWGPLGNGFPTPAGGHLMLVAGGIGQTPFLAVAREARGRHVYGDPPRALATPPERVTLCYGVKSEDLIACVERFEAAGVEVRLTTDDGSKGRYGFVTELLKEAIASGVDRPDEVFCCGPEPMMARVGETCTENGVPCWLSLESPMACGFGACFSCVVRVRTDEEPGWDYRRSCVEGPVFRADRLLP
jgi:dihydroorotate dehydrogenase electron transfer subunit